MAQGWGTECARRRADGVSSLVDTHIRLGEVSGGQRRRTLIVQGLAQEPDLLLWDEPPTGLDPEAVPAIRNLRRTG